MPRHRLLCSLLPGATLLLFTTLSVAQDANSREGTWRGVVAASVQNSVLVDVTIGSRTASLHFGEPANCRIVADHHHDGDGAAYYRFHPPKNGGGFCARLYPGDLTIDVPAPGSIAVVFQRSDSRWAGILKKTTTTTE